MDERQTEIDNFLTDTPWADATQEPLQQDASMRRYIRLHPKAPGDSGAIVMDAPPASGEDVRPFVNITRRLNAAGLSAPMIYKSAPAQGLLLLEDLGPALFADVLKQTPQEERALYRAATDVLIKLHAYTPDPGLQPYDAATMTPLAALAAVWYAPEPALAADIEGVFQTLAAEILPPPQHMIQRDYHAQNLIWLPEREGPARVGLLDYQDAMLGPLTYDLVSLTRDARRDVSPEIHEEICAYFANGTGQPLEDVTREAALCGAQRNLRILGVFARLWLRDGKPHYLPLLPRVWAHLHACLAHPDLAPLARATADLPAPTPGYLQSIKARR